MLMRSLMIFLLLTALTAPAWAQNNPLPADTVEAHFAAISAEEYTQADEYFSAAFHRAFKTEQRQQVDQYYLTRADQLARGYEIVDTRLLADEDKDTALVIVHFGDPFPEAFVGMTEEMCYYLIREHVGDDAPLAGRDGRAWRIDIFDAIRYDTLAEARRRPYLFTREAWPEDEGSELKSRQGLYRIQQALERFYATNGQYPFRLHGGTNRRDELISGRYFYGSYPDSGFNQRPMEFQDFGKKSAGDFAYYSVDADGDERYEGYWLLLHGKLDDSFYFVDRDAVYILSSLERGTQQELAELFAQFWLAERGRELQLAPGLLALAEPYPAARLETGAVAELAGSLPGSSAPTVIIEEGTDTPADGPEVPPLDLSSEPGPDGERAASEAPEPPPGEELPPDVALVPFTTESALTPDMRERAAALARAVISHVDLIYPAGEDAEPETVPTEAEDSGGESFFEELLRVFSFGW
ncbi:hypothetical protein JW859_02960 [bacterium]|nr:hypothetical protein [bacterium]